MQCLRAHLSKRVKYLTDSVTRLTMVPAKVSTNMLSATNINNNNISSSNRFMFSKRKMYWDLVTAMINRGRQANEVIDNIYKHYGYKASVTYILRKL